MQTRLLLEVFLISVLVAVLLAILIRFRKSTNSFPEAFKIFGPTSRTIGGPGNFKGRCGDQVEIYRGFVSHIISVTLENTGNCDIHLSFRDEIQSTLPDFTVVIAPGATLTRTGTPSQMKTGDGSVQWSTHNVVVAKCNTSEAPDCLCHYRWRVDSLGTIPHPGVNFT